jgi:hypothetical protein
MSSFSTLGAFAQSTNSAILDMVCTPIPVLASYLSLGEFRRRAVQSTHPGRASVCHKHLRPNAETRAGGQIALTKACRHPQKKRCAAAAYCRSVSGLPPRSASDGGGTKLGVEGAKPPAFTPGFKPAGMREMQ